MKKTIFTIILTLGFAFAGYAQSDTIPTIDKKRPKAVYQVGSAEVIVWENKGRDGRAWKNFSIEKKYKTSSGEWKTTHSFNESELLELRSAIDKAISEESVHVKD